MLLQKAFVNLHLLFEFAEPLLKSVMIKKIIHRTREKFNSTGTPPKEVSRCCSLISSSSSNFF